MAKSTSMPKRSSKSRDVSTIAFDIISQATGEERPAFPGKPAGLEKNPAAVALGRLGGKKGGPARSKALSKKRRKEIARKAAKKRWAAKNKSS